jgi:glycogen synthase
MSNSLRVLYAAGPGDVIGTYRYWVKGEDDPSQTSITYSHQFYNVCSALNAQTYLISANKNKQYLRDGQFILEHRPVPWMSAPGFLYHLGQVWYGLRLIVSALRFKADVVIVVEGSTHLFLMSVLPWLGIQVIPLLQCTLWHKFTPPTRLNRAIWQLSRRLLVKDCLATVIVSDDIAKQVKEITGEEHRPIHKIVPNYRRHLFADIPQPDVTQSPFRILFAGRIVPNKGIFDLLEMAKRLASEGRSQIVFDICGDGPALEPFRQAVNQAGLDSWFVCHGHCEKHTMRELLGKSHAVIVPTKTDFIEGLNKVVIEGVLAGRPTITSAVCPALSYVQEAIVEVPPNDVHAYGDAIIRLSEDREFYEMKQKNTLKVQEQFYDPANSWGATLELILLKMIKSVKSPKFTDKILSKFSNFA